jgi:hypothetical protein
LIQKKIVVRKLTERQNRGVEIQGTQKIVVRKLTERQNRGAEIQGTQKIVVRKLAERQNRGAEVGGTPFRQLPRQRVKFRTPQKRGKYRPPLRGVLISFVSTIKITFPVIFNAFRPFFGLYFTQNIYKMLFFSL